MKKIVSFLLTMSFVLSLTACGGKNPSESGTKEPNNSNASSKSTDEVVTVNFYEHADNEAIMTDLVAAYNAQSSNIKVNLKLIANDDYDDKIKVMLSGGADIDGFWLRGSGVTRQLAESGALLALDDLNAANSVDVSKYGPLGEAYSTEGKNYGLLFTKSSWLLWYNKDLFDAAGIDYPINLTWDQYTDLAKSLTTGDKKGGVCPDWVINLGAVAAGEYLSDENLTRTMDYSKHLEKWYVTDKSHPSIEDMSGSFDLNALFAEGNTYMMLNGDWAFQLLTNLNTNFTWAAAPLPRFKDTPEGTTTGRATGLSISAKSKHPAEVYDFIKFVCYSDEGAKISAQNSSASAYPSDEALEAYKKSVTALGTEYLFSAITSNDEGPEVYYHELNTAFKEELQNSLIGNCTLDQAFESYKKRRAEIVKK